MPIRIRWKSKEYFGIGLLLLGMCGFLQLFFIFIGQYFLEIGNYFVVILVPLGITLALFYASVIIFESYAQEVSFISTGGGAMLEILSGKDVPMVRALREKKP